MSTTLNLIASQAGLSQDRQREVRQMTDLIVGNEPNQPRFWQPQFGVDGSVASAKAL